MPSTLANTLFSPIVPDCSAGSRPALQEPALGGDFDAHLQPDNAEETAPPEAVSRQPDPEPVSNSPDTTSEAESEPGIASAADSKNDGHEPRVSDDAEEDRPDLERPTGIVQALSGATAIGVVAIEPAVGATSEDTPMVEVEAALVAEFAGSVEPAATVSADPSAALPSAPALPPIGVPVVSSDSIQNVADAAPSAALVSGVPPQIAANARAFHNGSAAAETLAVVTDEIPHVASIEEKALADDSLAPVEVRPEPDRPQVPTPPLAEAARPAARPEERAPLPANSSATETTTSGAPIPSVTSNEAPRVAVPAEVLAPGRPSSGPAPAIEVDSARLLQRVARAFAAAAQREGEVTIRLSPPDLGSLRLEARVEDGVLTARLHAETPEAQRAILENLSALRERLADQGVRIERFDVDLMNRQPGQSPQEPFDRQRDMPRLPRSVVAHRPAEPTAAQPAPRTILAAPGGLNVIV